MLNRPRVYATPVRVATGRDQKATMGCEERDREVKSGSEIATVHPSRSEKRRVCCRDETQNVAYRAVAFTGSTPDFDRERTCSWIAAQNYLILTQGASKIENKLYGA
ncbi:hypothetical protein Taro_022589 [Colocasia esculenta]|uniref:Uncharacterized protein n=1 Tax=Colocasia esculenta TaxID=4460 RepID=A0A843V1R7_COLES|nr:hypothetical protein [Colocasia esculenta]